MTFDQIAQRIEGRTPPRRLVRLIPKPAFVGHLGPEYRPYVMFGDYEEVQGLTVIEAAKRLYGGLQGARAEEYGGYAGYAYRGAWHDELQGAGVQAFDAVKDAEAFYVVTVSPHSPDLDLMPGTWKALATIITDPGRMHQQPDLRHRLLRLHDGQGPDLTLGGVAPDDLLGYGHPAENDQQESVQWHYYQYLSVDSGWATELLDHFGVNNRCWNGNGYVGLGGEWYARLFLGRNLPLSDHLVESCVLMKKDEVLPVLWPDTEAPEQKEVVWKGAQAPEAWSPEEVVRSHALADAAKRYDWPKVLSLLEAPEADVNGWRIGGKSGYTALHQAAHGGAPAEIVHRLLERGAFRSLKTLKGQRAVDIARQRGHEHLTDLLTPAPLLTVDQGKLERIEAGVHSVIRGREGIGPLLDRADMRLPDLAVLTEIPGHALWFPVPGMYGGFHLQLGQVAGEPVCIVDSWIRVVGGSEERRLVSAGGIMKLDFPLLQHRCKL